MRRSAPRKILVAVMVAYEADTLQIALSEYDGVADILISENLNVHTPHEKAPNHFTCGHESRRSPSFLDSKPKYSGKAAQTSGRL